MLTEKELTEIGYALVTASEDSRNWKNDCCKLIKHLRELEAKGGQAEVRVSFAEPNQQLFTIDEVTELLKEQKTVCANELVKFLADEGEIWDNEINIIKEAPEPKNKKLSEARSN